MTNYENFLKMTIEKFAASRVFRDMVLWYGDFNGVAKTYGEAIEKEIAWLKEEHK